MPATQTDRIGGLTTSVAVKAPVRVATTDAIALTGVQSIDGVLLQSGNGGDILPDRVLVKDQTDTTENGIYNVQDRAWVRTGDFNGAFDAVQGTVVLVDEGMTYAGAAFKLTTENPVYFGTSAIAFIQVSTFADTSQLLVTATGTPNARTLANRFKDWFNIEDYVSGGNYAKAMEDAANDLKNTTGGNGGTLVFPSNRTYNFEREALLPAMQNLKLYGGGTAKLVGAYSTTINTNISVFRIGGSTGTTTTLTADVNKGDKTLTVLSAAGLSYGQYFTINSAEYWNGETGISGFTPCNKYEILRVDDISGTTITLETPTVDSYNNTTYPVTVTPLNVVNMKMEGIEFVGAGKAQNTNNLFTGQRAVTLQYMQGMVLDDVVFRGFQGVALWNRQGIDSSYHNCKVIGLDPNIVPAGITSPGFYGIVDDGAVNSRYTNIYGEKCRRTQDSLGDLITRNVMVCTGQAVGNHGSGFGGHMGENFSFDNIQTPGCATALSLRQVNTKITNSTLIGVGTGLATINVGLGSSTIPNVNTPHAGSFQMSNCTIESYAGISLQTFVSTDSFQMDNVRINQYANNLDALVFAGTSVKNTSITDTKIKFYNQTGNGANGINFKNTATVQNIKSDIYIGDGTSIEGFSARGIVIEGNNPDVDAFSNPIDNVRIKVDFLNPRAGFTSYVDMGKGAGFFGDNINTQGCTGTDVAGTGGTIVFGRNFRAMSIGKIDEGNVVLKQATSTLPGGSTVLPLSRITNTTPTAAGYAQWIALDGGTEGTFATSLTGSGIANGGTTFSVGSTGSGQSIYRGSYLDITGAGVAAAVLTARVTNVTGTTVTIDTAASTASAAGAAKVNRHNPTLKGVGLIES